MLQAGEKVYVHFELVATGRPGHSSVPPGDNSIYHLAEALQRVAT